MTTSEREFDFISFGPAYEGEEFMVACRAIALATFDHQSHNVSIRRTEGPTQATVSTSSGRVVLSEHYSPETRIGEIAEDLMRRIDIELEKEHPWNLAFEQ